MSNPAYGQALNEEYSLKFGEMLKTEEFTLLFLKEIERIDNVDHLTPNGWLWLLNWSRAQDVQLQTDVLLKLSWKFSSAFMQVAIIDAATFKAEETTNRNYRSIRGFESRFIRELLSEATSKEYHSDKHQQQSNITRRSETILTALMQIGNDLTLAAARELLNHDWIGKEMLNDYFEVLCQGVDTETASWWRTKLKLSYEKLNGDE